MKRNLLAYGIIFLSLCCFLDLSVGWSSAIFIALAVLLFFQQRGEGMPLPPVSLILLANVLGYPIIVIVPWLYRDLWAHMNPYFIELAMLWATRGFAAFCCAYLFGDAFARRFHQQTHRGWDDAERLAYIRYAVHAFGIIAIAAWVVRQYYFGVGLTFITSRTALDVNSVESSVSQVLNLLIFLRDPFLFFCGVMYIRRLHDRFMWPLFAGVAVGLLVEIITIGSKAAIIRLLVIAALVIACTTRRMSWKQFCAGALMLFTVYMAFMVITEYRGILGDKHRRGEDVFDVSVQAETFSEAFLVSLPFTEKIEQRRTVINEEDIFNRISSGMFSFGNLLYYTGGRSPHEHALEAFLIPLYSIMPRALIEKPIFFNAARFGQEYFHTSTAISVSTLGGFYYAWGYVGILAGMAALGATLAFFIQRTLLRTTAFNSAVVMVTLVMNFVNVSTNFQVAAMALCRLAVILLALYMLYPIIKRLKSGRATMLMPVVSRTGGGL